MRSRIGTAEPAAEIAEVALFTPVDVLAHTAREHRPRDAAEHAKRLGQPQALNLARRRILREQRHQRIGHPGADTIQFSGARGLSEIPVTAGERGQMPACGVETSEAAVAADDRETPSEMHRCRMNHVAVLDERKLRGASADVDVEHRRAPRVRHLSGTRAVRRQHRLHMVAGGSTHEFATDVRDHVGNRLGVLAPKGLAGQDHSPCVDVVRMQPRRFIRGVHDAADRLARRCARRSGTE